MDAKLEIAQGISLTEAVTRYEISGASDVNIGGSCFDIGVGKIGMDDDEGGFECHMILVRREDERKVGVVGR